RNKISTHLDTLPTKIGKRKTRSSTHSETISKTLPADSELRPLTRVVLRAAVNRLSTGPATTTAEVQNRARLVQALYLALDRLDTTRPPAPAT
ncbi:hypothetical protein AB0C94_34395, partial [Streptomyces griseus]